MFYAPMLILMSLCKDLFAVLGGVATMLGCLAAAHLMNTPDWYRKIRLVTWIFRAAFFFFTFGRMNVQTGGTAMNGLGFAFALIFTVLEMCVGDCGAICAYRMHCSYEVKRVLPNRIFICSRDGAAHSQDIFGPRAPPDEKITGIASDAWRADMALIADVKGLVVELKPMMYADWHRAFEDKDRDTNADGTKKDEPMRYIGLDVFSKGQATLNLLDAANAMEAAVAGQKRKTLTEGAENAPKLAPKPIEDKGKVVVSDKMEVVDA
jgi:hypothetical protein